MRLFDNKRFKGYGFVVWFVVIGAFLILRPLFEKLTTGSEDALKRHVNGAALLVSGVITFLIAARADKGNGIDVFSRQAWTRDIMHSEHIFFYMPMRFVSLLLMVVSLPFWW